LDHCRKLEGEGFLLAKIFYLRYDLSVNISWIAGWRRSANGHRAFLRRFSTSNEPELVFFLRLLLLEKRRTMNIEAILLCNSATNQQGQWNYLGVFDTIFTRQVPLKLPVCVLVIRIRFEKIEEGNHKITIHIIDEDGKSICPCPKWDIPVSIKVPNKLDSTMGNFALQLPELNFAQYGKYRIDLAIDGQIKGSQHLDVFPVPEQL